MENKFKKLNIDSIEVVNKVGEFLHQNDDLELDTKVSIIWQMLLEMNGKQDDDDLKNMPFEDKKEIVMEILKNVVINFDKNMPFVMPNKDLTRRIRNAVVKKLMAIEKKVKNEDWYKRLTVQQKVRYYVYIGRDMVNDIGVPASMYGIGRGVETFIKRRFSDFLTDEFVQKNGITALTIMNSDLSSPLLMELDKNGELPKWIKLKVKDNGYLEVGIEVEFIKKDDSKQ